MNAGRLKRLADKHYERKPRNHMHAYYLHLKRFARACDMPLHYFWPWYHPRGRDL